MSAVNIKLMPEISDVKDCEILLEDLDALTSSQDGWMTKINRGKYRVVRYVFFWRRSRRPRVKMD